MRAGALKDRCDIQQDGSADDNPHADWTGTPLVRNWPCDIQAVGGDESYRGRQLEAKVDYVVECRMVDAVTSQMRLSVTGGIHKGKTLNIDHIRDFNDRKGRRLELYCTELK